MSAKSRTQYRPSLCMEELEELLTYIPKTSALFAKLHVYTIKANLGLNSAAYIGMPKDTIAARLGMTAESNAIIADQVVDRAAVYQARLAQKQELAPATLSKEERFEILAAKSFNGELTLDEAAEGRALEQELYGMDMGTFPAAE